MKPSYLLLLCAAVLLLFLAQGAYGAECTDSSNSTSSSEIAPLTTEAAETLLFFGFVVILCGAVLIVFIIIEVKFHYLPESVAVVIYGILIGLVLRYINTAIAEHLKRFDPELFFLFLLPSIIFESGFSLQKAPFFANIGSIMVLAIFGTAISFGFIGISLWGLGKIGVNMPLTLQESMSAGAMLSTTDTVATLAIFQALHVDQQLYMIVFGESVLNDAVGFILFKAAVGYKEGEILTTLYLFFKVSLGSLLLGIAIAILLSAILRFINISRYPPLETIFMIMFSYMSYVLADSLELSGIMSVFWCGLVFNHYGAFSLSPYTTLTSRQLFRTLAFVCETSVFIYIGISLTTMPIDFKVDLVKLIFSIIVSCLAGRAVHVYLLCNILNLFNSTKLSLRMQTAIWFSGLMRGALAFSLTFQLTTDAAADLKTATLIFVHFTLFAMGCGTLPLLKVLKIDSASSDQSLDHISELPKGAKETVQRGSKVQNFWARIDNNYFKKWLRRPMPPLAQEAIDLFEHLVKNASVPSRERELPDYTRNNNRPLSPEAVRAAFANTEANGSALNLKGSTEYNHYDYPDEEVNLEEKEDVSLLDSNRQ